MELIEEILSEENLNEAIKRVKANKGAPGIDERSVKEFQVEETGEYIFSLNITVHDDPGYYSGIVLTDSNDKCINGLVGLYTDSMKMYSVTLKKDTTYKVYVVQMTDEHQYRDCMRYFCQKGDDSSLNYNFEIENTSVNYFYRVVRK